MMSQGKGHTVDKELFYAGKTERRSFTGKPAFAKI